MLILLHGDTLIPSQSYTVRQKYLLRVYQPLSINCHQQYSESCDRDTHGHHVDIVFLDCSVAVFEASCMAAKLIVVGASQLYLTILII